MENRDEIVKELREAFAEDEIILDEPLGKHTTYKIGGPADIFVKPNSTSHIAHAIKIANKYNINYFLLGKGSNLLVSDKGYRGMIIYLSSKFSEAHFENDVLVVHAGASIIAMSFYAQREGFSGLEFACGIPGTIGGAVCMNAGAYGTQTSEILIEATVIDTNGKILTLTNDQLEFDYRKSIIPINKYIVTCAKFQLKEDDPDAIKSRMDEYTLKRTSTQPVDKPNAGSVFKRPEGEYPGKLIDDAGLKGYRIGGAVVSEKHANFIINAGGATAKDVLDLVEYIKQKVYENSGIMLEMEIKILGEI